MLSRVADSLYWMSRYLERAEHTTRLLDVNLNLMLDESSTSSDRRWQRLLQTLGKPKRVKWDGNPYELARTLTFDVAHKSSVVSCIISARENARHVREQISTEQWHRLNSLYLEVTRPEFKKALEVDGLEGSNEAPSAFLQAVMEAVHQFQGRLAVYPGRTVSGAGICDDAAVGSLQRRFVGQARQADGRQ
jgi:uncharacterized alpha-E superfamily protein